MEWNDELSGNEEIYTFPNAEEMIKSLKEPLPRREQPCLHKGCSKCHGTGRTKNEETCIHLISCPCPKCNPHRM